MAALPKVMLVLADHDSAPTALFETAQLRRLAAQALPLHEGSCDDLQGVVSCIGMLQFTEPCTESNAGLVIVFPSTAQICDSAEAVLQELLRHRRNFAQRVTPVPGDLQAPVPFEMCEAAMRRPFACTPLHSAYVVQPSDFLTAWAMVGECMQYAGLIKPAGRACLDGGDRRSSKESFRRGFRRQRVCDCSPARRASFSG